MAAPTDRPRGLRSVRLTAGPDGRQVVRVRTDTAVTEPVVLEAGGSRTVALDGAPTRVLRVEDDSGRVGNRTEACGSRCARHRRDPTAAAASGAVGVGQPRRDRAAGGRRRPAGVRARARRRSLCDRPRGGPRGGRRLRPLPRLASRRTVRDADGGRPAPGGRAGPAGVSGPAGQCRRVVHRNARRPWFGPGRGRRRRPHHLDSGTRRRPAGTRPQLDRRAHDHPAAGRHGRRHRRSRAATGDADLARRLAYRGSRPRRGGAVPGDPYDAATVRVDAAERASSLGFDSARSSVPIGITELRLDGLPYLPIAVPSAPLRFPVAPGRRW